tara:strand:+ start:8545 stop:11778 length:3234 start_codon:yes stop_codon:yes gene_type:complete
MRTYKWSSFQKQQNYTDAWRDYLNSPPPNPHGWYGLVAEQYEKQLLSEGITRDPLDDPEFLEELFGRKRGWEREVEKFEKEDAEKAAAAKAGRTPGGKAKEGGPDWGATVAQGSRGATAPGEYKAATGIAGKWEGIKAWLAKAAPLERSGKLMRGREQAYIDAKERLNAAAEKAADQLVNRDLAGLMKQKYPEFPNMRTNEEFRDALLDVGTIYDSVVASTQKDREDPEYLDPTSANYLIAYLREFTQYNLDNELADAFKHFKESKELEEAAPFKGVVDQNPERRTPAGTPDTPGVGAPEGPEGKYTQRAAKKGSHSDASTTIQGLKSNTLPAILGLLGAAASGAAGYVAMTTSTPPIDPAATKEEIWKTVSQSVETNVNLAADPNGTLAMFANGAGDPQNFQDIAGNIDKIAAAGGITPDEVISTYSDVAMMGEESEVALKAVYEWGKQGGDISAWGAGGGVPTAEFQEFVTANPAFKDIHEYVSQTGFGAGTGVASDVAAGAAGGAVETVGDFANAGFSSDQLDQIANRAHEIFKDDLVTGYRGAATSATSAGVADPGAAPSPQALRSAIDNALQSVKGGTTDLGVPLEGTASGDQWTAIGRAANELGGGEGGAGMERLLGLDADKVMAVGSTVSTITFKVFMGMGTRAAAAAGGAGAAAALGVGAAAAPILGALGIAGITGGIAVKLIRMKGLKSSRAQMMADLLDELQDVPAPPPEDTVCPEGQTWDEQQKKCVPGTQEDPGPGPTDPEPGPTEPEPEPGPTEPEPGPTEPEPGPGTPKIIKKPKPILIRYDKDDIKIYAPSIRSPKQAEAHAAKFEKAQAQGIQGRLDEAAFKQLEAYLLKEITAGLPGEEQVQQGEIGTDELERELKGFAGSRGGRWAQTGKPFTLQALKRQFARLGKKRETKDGAIVRTQPVLQIFHVVDMSIKDDFAEIGVPKAFAAVIAKYVIQQLVKKKKVQLAAVSVKGILRALTKKQPALAGKEGEILGVLSAYNLVRAKASATARKPAQKPVGPTDRGYTSSGEAEAERMAAQEGLKRTQKTLKESKRRALTEAKENEAWDKLTNRWKKLSGIK